MIMLVSSCSAYIAWMILLSKLITFYSQLSCGTIHTGVTGPNFTYLSDVWERATFRKYSIIPVLYCCDLINFSMQFVKFYVAIVHCQSCLDRNNKWTMPLIISQHQCYPVLF